MSSGRDRATQGFAELRFRVNDLLARRGSKRSEQCTVEPGELSIGSVAATREPASVHVELESVNDGIRAVATVEYAWQGECRRCLGAAAGTSTISMLDLFVEDPDAYEGSEAHLLPQHGHEPAGDPGDSPEEIDAEVRELVDGWVDLSESVREAMLLGLPLAPLCDEVCAGPAPGEFPVGLHHGDRDPGGEPPGDPRWAGLEDLHFDPEDP